MYQRKWTGQQVFSINGIYMTLVTTMEINATENEKCFENSNDMKFDHGK